jgi:hypothetical protein
MSCGFVIGEGCSLHAIGESRLEAITFARMQESNGEFGTEWRLNVKAGEESLFRGGLVA